MIRNFTPGVFFLSFALAGCGSGKPITVSPASADAQNFPGGIVQFTATGASSPTWCIGSVDGMCNGNVVSPATVDATGRAQCVPGRSGTVTVLAGTGLRMANPDGGSQLAHFGSAQLTCP